jgi:hypothetical protein
MNILLYLLTATYMYTYPPKCDTVNYVNYTDKQVFVPLKCNNLISSKKLSIEHLAKGAIPIDRDSNYFYTNLIYNMDQVLTRDNSSFWSEYVSRSEYFYCGKLKVHKNFSTCIILVQNPLWDEAYMLNIDSENFLISKIGIAHKGAFSILQFTRRMSKNGFLYLGYFSPSQDKMEIYSKSSFSIDKEGFCRVEKLE